MNRIPEPRTQAEILVATLAAKGVTLGRRESLEVIAKISGYKGWNEYAADLKKPATQLQAPARRVETLKPEVAAHIFRDDEWVSAYNFTLGSIGAEAGHGISAMRLAKYFQHSTFMHHTVLAQAVVNTKVYELVCRGKIEVMLPSPAPSLTEAPRMLDSSVGFSEEDLLLLEDDEALAKMTVFSKPECVWLSEMGIPVQEGEDMISTDPLMELRILLLTRNFRSKSGG